MGVRSTSDWVCETGPGSNIYLLSHLNDPIDYVALSEANHVLQNKFNLKYTSHI